MIIGTISGTHVHFAVRMQAFLQNHTFVTAITRAGKTGLLLKIIEGTRTADIIAKYSKIPITIIDSQDEFLNVPEFYDDFVVFSKDQFPKIFSADDAFNLGRHIRQMGISIIPKISDIPEQVNREKFVAEFVAGMASVERQHWTPHILIIDEADQFIPNREKRKPRSKDVLIDVIKRAGKTNLVVILATQHPTDVDITARSNCSNRIAGKTVELSYRKLMAKMLGDDSIEEKLWTLQKGEFFMKGDAFSDSLVKVQVFESKISRPDAGLQVKEPQTKQVYHDIISSAVESKSREPYVVQLEHKLNELQSLYILAKANEMTKEDQNRIHMQGFNEGYKQAHYEILRKQKTVPKESTISRILKRL